MLPPHPTQRRLQRSHDFEAATGLQYPLSTLHEQCCRRPCKTRFRLAGSASTGRASNPLDHYERFQVTSVLLPRTCPDASWSHARRKFFDLARLNKAPIAIEAVARIDALFAIEREINGSSPQDRRRVARKQPAAGRSVGDLAARAVRQAVARQPGRQGNRSGSNSWGRRRSRLACRQSSWEARSASPGDHRLIAHPDDPDAPPRCRNLLPRPSPEGNARIRAKLYASGKGRWRDG